MTKPKLRLRTLPKQKRSRETFLVLLDTSAKLLEEVGFDGFNTNLLAERSGFRVATIYRYFPNKMSILNTLIKNWMEILEERLTGFQELSDTSIDWHTTLEKLIDTYIALAKNHTGFSAIRRAIQATPELRSIEMELIQQFAHTTVNSMKKRGVKASREELHSFAMTYIVAVSAAIDLAWIKKESIIFDDDIVGQVKRFSAGYFGTYLA